MYQEHSAHISGVSQIRFSHDDEYLFTIGQDGTMFIFRIASKAERVHIDRDNQLSDEILITKSDIAERQNIITDLSRQIDEIKLEHEYQLRLKDMNYGDKLKGVTEEYSEKIESEKIITTDLRLSKDQDEIDFTSVLEGLKAGQFNNFHVSSFVFTGNLTCRPLRSNIIRR